MRKWFILLLISVIFLPMSVFADVDDSFNIWLNGGATGYGWIGINTGFGSDYIYQPYNLTPTITDNGYRYSYSINNAFSIGNSHYPLSFVDILSNDSTSNQCSGVGCNIAYQIPTQLSIRCDSSYCGIPYSPIYVNDSSQLCLNSSSDRLYFCNSSQSSRPIISDLLPFLDDSRELRFIYNFLNNNGIQFYYQNTDGRLLSSNSEVDFSSIALSIAPDHITILHRGINSDNSYSYIDTFNVFGKIYNNAFDNFHSIRLFLNYPYTLETFIDFNRLDISFTNFNVNTTITGVIPDFPENPSLSPSDIIESIDIENGLDTSIEFFSNFNDTDNNGISSIVSAPLVAIRSMLSNQCTPVSISVYNKQIQLPCGSTFWGRQDVLTFKVTYNTIIGGYLCYCILRNLFILIHNMKDPDNDKVEVMDL